MMRMKPRALLAVAIICGALPLHGCGDAEVATDTVKSRIRGFLPPHDDSSDLEIGDLGDLAPEEQPETDLTRVAAMDSFPKWKKFEDEHISFRYPDDPRVKLEVEGPEVPIPIKGGPLRDGGISFFRSYRLAVGKDTYGLLMLEKAEGFDDTVCFCGFVVYQKYLFHNGALHRFDFLRDGNVKKAQMVCSGFRVTLFEWTHMPMTQDVYIDLALGVKLAAAPCDEAAMKKAVVHTYGFRGRLGFLEKGMSRDEVVAVLGTPQESTESSLTYIDREGRSQTTTTIRLHGGVLKSLEKGWRKHERLPAKRGSVDWIVETVDSGTDVFVDDSERVTLSREDIDYIFDRFAEIGPSVQGHDEWEHHDWYRLCEAIHKLREAGHTDKRVLPIVRKRFFENIDQYFAALLLQGYDPEGSRGLIVRKIRRILDEATKEAASEDKEEADSTFHPCDDLHGLIRILDESRPKRAAFMLEAMDHPHPRARRSGFLLWQQAPAADAYPRLVRGLADSYTEVRREAALAFAISFGSEKDIPLLKKRLSIETDERIIENLKEAVARLEKREAEPNNATDAEHQ